MLVAREADRCGRPNHRSLQRSPIQIIVGSSKECPFDEGQRDGREDFRLPPLRTGVHTKHDTRRLSEQLNLRSGYVPR